MAVDIMPEYSSIQYPEYFIKNQKEDITQLNNLLQTKDYKTIIENSQLFSNAFLKILSPKTNRERSIYITQEENALILTGISYSYNELINALERLREIFVKEYAVKKSITIVCVDFEEKCFILNKKNDNSFVNLRDLLINEKSTPSIFFHEYILPNMQAFCEILGATCSNDSNRITIKSTIPVEAQQLEPKIFEISWGATLKSFTYPIPPKKIERGNLEQSISSLYKEQKFCDIVIKTKDENVIKAHSTILFAFGGEMIQSMLTANMKESNEKIICFSDFSKDVIKAFVDFIYFGEKELEPNSFSKRNVDLSELLRMAHTYQVLPLINHCTNLFSLLSTKENAEDIKCLADFYNNDHLKELYQCLSGKNKTKYIKV